VRLRDVRLGWPPQPPPQLLIGATGPKTLELSGALADGTVLTICTGPAGVHAARPHIDAGRTKAGVERSHDIVCYVLTAFGDDAEARIAAELAAFDSPAAPREVAAYGDSKSIGRRIAEFIESGVTTVVLEPPPTSPISFASSRPSARSSGRRPARCERSQRCIGTAFTTSAMQRPCSRPSWMAGRRGCRHTGGTSPPPRPRP